MKSIFYILMLAHTYVISQIDVNTEFVHDFEETISNHNSWEYDVHYKMKYFSADDTLNYFTNCRMIRHKSDTLFGGSLWIKNDSIDRYYDLENIYIINHLEKKIMRFFPHKGQDWAINGHTVSGVINSYFLKPKRISRYLNDSTTSFLLNDSIIKSDKFRAISFKFADDLPIEKRTKKLLFNKNNVLKHIIYSVKLQNEWQYNEWHFSNETYDKVNDEILKSEFDSLAKIYTIEDYQKPDPEEMKPLRIGTEAPNFTGLNFQINDSIQLNQYKGKVVILDFWYKDCFPCMQAIPFFNRMNEKYPSQEFVILGLNPFDNQSKKIEKLNKFIELNKMNYATIFIDKSTVSDYNVRSYPTFYVIDKNGKIILSKIGYSEENEEEIEHLLDDIIR